MSIWEKWGFKKGPKLTPEQEQENQRVATAREILMLEKRMEEVEENVRMFGSAPADNTLLSNLQERIDKLNKKLVALGGKPIKREGGDRGPVPTARQKRGSKANRTRSSQKNSGRNRRATGGKNGRERT